MKNEDRVQLYIRHLQRKYTDGFARLTPTQRRRVRKHDNKNRRLNEQAEKDRG